MTRGDQKRCLGDYLAKSNHGLVLGARITQMHERSRDSYGARRIHLDLRDEGVRVGRKRVERLMRSQGLSGYVKRRKLRALQRARRQGRRRPGRA